MLIQEQKEELVDMSWDYYDIRKEETDSDLFGTSKMVQVLDDYK